MPITVDTHKYEAVHVKKPRGHGFWAFDIAGETYTFRGSYSECKARAIKKANEISRRGKPIFRIYALG